MKTLDGPAEPKQAAAARPLGDLHPAIAIFIAQAAAWVLVYFGIRVFGFAWSDAPLALRAGLIGGAAAISGVGMGLGKGWLPLQIGLPFAVFGAQTMAIPAWVFLSSFVILALVYSNSARGRVPLYLTNPKTRAAIAALLPPRPHRFADLGCGLGGVVLGLARLRRDSRFVGIESAPIPLMIAFFRAALAAPGNVRLRFKDFWKADLGEYDVVYCFLSPVPMADLYRKARAEMRPGSRLISNSFAVPDVPPTDIVDVADRRGTRLFIWDFE